jgi:uncharacterized protein GlcG (DUF336 family)
MHVAVVDSGGNLVAFQRMDGAMHLCPSASEGARHWETFRECLQNAENSR